MNYYFYNKDLQGSTTNVIGTDSSGSAVSEVSYVYGDFGETTVNNSSSYNTSSGSDFYNEICYTGGIYDQSTGLYYLNARYYDPDDAGFTTQDTYRGDVNDPDTLNLYAYCTGDPINFIDPSGHSYSPAKAVEYAKKWAFKFNPEYKNYTGSGDCTNFVSQCIHAGGCKMKFTKNLKGQNSFYDTTKYWYSKKYSCGYYGNYEPVYWKLTSSWIRVKDFYKYWRNHGANKGECKSKKALQSKARIGDVVQLYTKSENWYHSIIISGGRRGALTYAAHSNSHVKKPISAIEKNAATAFRIIRPQ